MNKQLTVKRANTTMNYIFVFMVGALIASNAFVWMFEQNASSQMSQQATQECHSSNNGGDGELLPFVGVVNLQINLKCALHVNSL